MDLLYQIDRLEVVICTSRTMQKVRQASAEAQVKEACEKLLANQIMEAFTFTMEAVETVA